MKILSEESKPWALPSKDVLEKETQPNILNQPEQRVRINETANDAGNLELNDSEIVWSITIVLQMKLNRSYNLP